MMKSTIQVHSPYDGHLIEELPENNASDIEHALQTTARLAEGKGRHLSPARRIEILEDTAHWVEDRQEELARQAAVEGGKPLIDSRVEIQRAVQGIREAARSIPEMTGREIPMNVTASSINRRAFTLREPIGPVVAISAFNHPFNLIVHQVIPALAVGCPVIVKPSLVTPLSCRNLLRGLQESGLPEGECQMALCDNTVAEKLVTDSRVAFLSFIGSAKVGWWLRSQLAPGTRCALEHGGAAPVILEPDADLGDAIPHLVKGGFYHAGQVCVSVQRVFAHESILGEVCENLVQVSKGLKVGDPVQDQTEVGPLILEREVDRVAQWVEEAEKAGARILLGGQRMENNCYAPTLLLNPPEDARVSQQEIFGPVISVYAYRERSEAIERANRIPYAFQASVFTKNLDAALDAAQKLDAAAVMVNDHTAFRVDWMPFAGRKESGLGVGGIRPTMEEMMEEKMIVFKSNVL